MFGYVKPLQGELLVKEYELYRGLYCGLCDEIRHRVSLALSFSLSYDFVFLALIRALAEDREFVAQKKRCPVHPMKKRSHIDSCPPLAFCARAALLLTYEKLKDDQKDPDTPFFKRLLLYPYHALLKHDRKKLLKRCPEFKPLADSFGEKLRQMRQLEETQCQDVDVLCRLFGELMGELTSFGLEGKGAVVCYEIGDFTGRLIYLADACDDLENDEKTGAFNPLLLCYHSAENARSRFLDLDLVFSLYASRLDAALGLFSSQREYKSIAQNIISRGIGALSRRVLKPMTQTTL